MRLYLLRHGKAVKDDEDRTRPLAPRGERLRFETATLACFERGDDGTWRTAWSETPPRYTKVA